MSKMDMTSQVDISTIDGYDISEGGCTLPTIFSPKSGCCLQHSLYRRTVEIYLNFSCSHLFHGIVTKPATYKNMH